MNKNVFSLKRLQKEMKEINEQDDVQFSIGLADENNWYEWNITMEGPRNTIYDGHLFQACLKFPENYPLNPPKMSFITKMYHPNIFQNGDVCISILNSNTNTSNDESLFYKLDEGWKPSLGVKQIIYSVLSILSDPNTESPANSEASKDFSKNYETYKKKVQKLLRENEE